MLLLHHDRHGTGKVEGRMKDVETAASAAILHSAFILLPSDSNGIRDRTCTDLASQALQVSYPVKDVRFARCSGPT